MKTKQERGQMYGCEKRCVLRARLKRGQGGCLSERQREFVVPGRRTKDGERTRANCRTCGQDKPCSAGTERVKDPAHTGFFVSDERLASVDPFYQSITNFNLLLICSP